MIIVPRRPFSNFVVDAFSLEKKVEKPKIKEKKKINEKLQHIPKTKLPQQIEFDDNAKPNITTITSFLGIITTVRIKVKS